MGGSVMELKTSYEVGVKLEPFYSGGALAVSPDGSLLACACYQEVKIVESGAGKVIQTLQADSEPITAVSWDKNSGKLFAASRSLQLRCWESQAWSCLRSWKAHTAAITCLALDSSGAILISGSADRCVRAWSTEGYHCTHVFRGHKAVVLQVLVIPKKLQVVSSSEDGEIRIWDLVSQSCLASLSAHESAVTALSCSLDGEILLSAGRDKIAILWDLQKRKKQATIPVFEAVEGAVLLPQKKEASRILFATGGEKGIVKVWDSKSNQAIAEQRQEGPFEEGSQLTNLILGSENQLISTSEDAKVQFLDPQARKGETSTIGRMELRNELIGNQGEITDLRFIGQPGQKQWIAVATNSSIVRLYNTESGQLVNSLYGHGDVVLVLDSIQWSEDSTILVSGSKDMSFRIWKLKQAIISVNESTKSRELVQVGESIQSEFLIGCIGHSGAVTAACFTLKNSSLSLITGSSDKLLKVWDLTSIIRENGKSGDKLQSIAAVQAHSKDINSISVSPNGNFACSASQDKLAKTWRLPSLVQHLTLTGHKRGIWSAIFSKLEQVIATGSGDKTIKLWSLSTGQCLRTFQGHTSSVLKLYFLPSGLQILSVGSDSLMKLWNVRSSECTATFEEHEGKIWALTGSQAELIASGGADATICVWHDTTQASLNEEINQQSARIEANQALANAIQDGKLIHAAKLALQSGQSRTLLAVLEKAQDVSEQDQTEQIFKALVVDMSDEQLKKALEVARDWNTNSKLSGHAQGLLNAILRLKKPKVFFDYDGKA